MSATSARLNSSYFLLESCLLQMGRITTEASPPLEREKLKEEASALGLKISALNDRAPAKPADFFSYLSNLVNYVTVQIIASPAEEKELAATSLALKLLIPIGTFWEESLAIPSLVYSCSEHEAKISALKDQWENLRKNIAKVDSAASSVFKALIEQTGSAVRQLEIDSVIEQRHIALNTALDGEAHNLEAFNAHLCSVDLTAPGEMARAFVSYQQMNASLFEMTGHAKELGGEPLISCAYLSERLKGTKTILFAQLFGQIEKKATDLSKLTEFKAVLSALVETDFLLRLAKSIPDEWRSATGGCEKEIENEATSFIILLTLCKARLQCQKLENDLAIIEKAKADFPALKDIPLERAEELLKVLDSFKSEYRTLQRIWIGSGIPEPEELTKKREPISITYYALRDWVDSHLGDSEEEKPLPARSLRERFKSLASTGSV